MAPTTAKPVWRPKAIQSIGRRRRRSAFRGKLIPRRCGLSLALLCRSKRLVGCYRKVYDCRQPLLQLQLVRRTTTKNHYCLKTHQHPQPGFYSDNNAGHTYISRSKYVNQSNIYPYSSFTFCTEGAKLMVLALSTGS